MPQSPSKPKKKTDLASLAILFLPLAFLLGIAGGWIMWGQDGGSNTAAAAYPVDDDPFLGPEDAPVTIIEFSDYQCPYCAMWYQEVFTRLMAEYPDQVRFVYRDFPLTSIHPGAQPAAEAANCANEQDKYWEFHNAIFSGNYDLTRDGFLNMASDLGLDLDDFTTCYDSGRYAAEVQGDLQDALNLGIQSTPTFLVNGRQVIGAQPYETFKSMIDSILAGGN